MTTPARASGGGRRAAFLDRDGTLIRDANYLSDSSKVELLPGVIDAVLRLQTAGFALVVVTNQSGIARGLLTEADYERVRTRLDELLAERGVRLTASYHCPHHPDANGPCECRKPGTLLHRQAAAEHGLDLARSIFLGDRWRDVEPALTLGGRGILIPNAETPAEEVEEATRRARVIKSLGAAVALVVGELAG
jgi:histidinol-phosphate phosphatase family protein